MRRHLSLIIAVLERVCLSCMSEAFMNENWEGALTRCLDSDLS